MSRCIKMKNDGDNVDRMGCCCQGKNTLASETLEQYKHSIPNIIVIIVVGTEEQ
jgi:hypothetical protein